MKRRGERREGRGRLEKLPELISHLTLQTKCPISPPASPFFALRSHLWVRAPVRCGANFLPPRPRHPPHALKCIGCLRAEWTGLGRARGSPNGKPAVASRRRINQAAKRTPEKVPSKQTHLSHDSRGTAGPHRSQPATLSQREYSAEHTVQSWNLMPD